MKKIIVLLVMVIVMSTTAIAERDTEWISAKKVNYFTRINSQLVYDPHTKIVYYYFISYGGYSGYGFLSPYYSKDGKLCRYVEGNIIEITE